MRLGNTDTADSVVLDHLHYNPPRKGAAFSSRNTRTRDAQRVIKSVKNKP
jgi:hypothetical protein